MKKCTLHLLLALTLIFMLISVGMGQSKKISIRSKNESLRHVLEEISQKSNVQFIFDDKLVNGKTVTCDVQAKTAQEALKEILDEFGLAFREVQEDRIVLYEQPPQERRFKLTGRVTDASTGEPLYFANVFLSNTTLGCATDKDGRYTIERIPPGPYDLVATMMGYEAVSASLEFFDEPEKIVHFKLKPIPIQGETISVTAKYPKDWKENLKIFEQLLFGSGAFAKECSLVNPEVLDFERSRTFRAYNEQPAIFINNALGYRVSFLLIHFESNDNYSLRTYKAATAFEELDPKDDGEREKWIQNRLDTYNGSMRHFIRALWEHRLKQEGFTVSRPRANREYKVDPDTLLAPGDKPSQYILKPCPGRLKITYNKRDDESYQVMKKALEQYDSPYNEMRLRNKYAKQENIILIQKPILIIVNSDIVIITDSPVQFGNTWIREKAPKWLPADYKPPKGSEK